MQKLGTTAGFLISAAVNFMPELIDSNPFISKLLPPFSRHSSTQFSTARSIKDDHLLDSVSDGCLAARCPSSESYLSCRVMLMTLLVLYWIQVSSQR